LRRFASRFQAAARACVCSKIARFVGHCAE
jgi:hypothetical protein